MGIIQKDVPSKKIFLPQKISFGNNKAQYFLFYDPDQIISNKVIVWIHGGGWNADSPGYFDFVGQCIAQAGYRFVSLGYRLSPKNKYPCQIEDVCEGYQKAIAFLESNL